MRRGAHAAWLAVLAVVALGGACRRDEARPARAATVPLAAPLPPATPAADPVRALVDDLAQLALGDVLAPDVAAARAAALTAGTLTVEALVDELVADPRLGSRVAPSLLVRDHFAASNLPVILALGKMTMRDLPGYAPELGAPDAAVYVLRYPLCNAADVVSVAPWWDMTTTVRVCPDAYRPEVKGDGKYQCGGRMLDQVNSRVCGCGPNLVQCARDERNLGDIRAATRDEVIDTIADTVNRDLPLAQVFLRQDSVRNPITEMLDRRWQIMAGKAVALDDLAGWPSGAGRGATPRREGFAGHHAGILTTPHMQLRFDAPRATMRTFYELLWCQEPAAAKVDTAVVLGLHALDLRQGEGWQQLASMPVCTACHARLDYGVTFFSGFPSPLHAVDFLPAKHKTGRGPLYRNDIDDKIGEGPLTPQGFAQLATKHPAFGRCMVEEVAQHVFGAAPQAEDRAVITAAFKSRGTLRALMRAALVRYGRTRLAAAKAAPAPVAAAPDTAAPAAAPAPAATAVQGDDALAIPEALGALLEAHCNDCHDVREAKLSTPTLPRDLVAHMLDQVAFGGMPRERPLVEADRVAMVRALVAVLWPDPAAQRDPLAYYEGAMRAARVHRPSTLLRTDKVLVGDTRDLTVSAVEDVLPAPLNQLTPGYAATAGIMAAVLCRDAKAPGQSPDAAVQACMARLLAPSMLQIDR